MVLLKRLYTQGAFLHGLDGQGRGLGPCQGSGIGDIKGQGRAADGVGFTDGFFVARGVDDQMDFIIFNHVYDMWSAFTDLFHSLIDNPVF